MEQVGMDRVDMDQEGLLIEVDRGRVTRVLTNGTPLPGGAAVIYDGAETRVLPVREPTNAEQIERIAAALREGRSNTQRQGIRKACERAAGHYQAIAKAAGALAGLLEDLKRTPDGEPVALVTRMQEAVNRIDADILREVRQQFLVACAAAMELDFDADDQQRPPAIPPVVPNFDLLRESKTALPETSVEQEDRLPRIAVRSMP
jgi:hypothetical protein